MENKPNYPRGIEPTVGMIIEREDGKILITLSPKWKNKWSFPGGHIELGEKIVETAEREGEEETGLKLKGISVFNADEIIGSEDFHRPAHFLYFDVYCQVIGGELKLDGTELTGYKWMTPHEALQMDLAESFGDSIKKFIEYKKKK